VTTSDAADRRRLLHASAELSGTFQSLKARGKQRLKRIRSLEHPYYGRYRWRAVGNFTLAAFDATLSSRMSHILANRRTSTPAMQ